MNDRKTILELIAGFGVALLSVSVPWILADEIPPEAGLRFILLIAACVLIAAVGLVISFGSFQSVRLFWRRRRGLDLAFRPWFWRHLRWITHSFCRLTFSVWISKMGRLAGIAVACGILLILIVRFTGVQKHGLGDFIWIFALFTLASFLFLMFEAGVQDRLLTKRSEDELWNGVHNEIAEWRSVDMRLPEITKTKFGTALMSVDMPPGAGMDAADIAICDSGPIRVYSINYYEWLVEKDGWRLLEEILTKNKIQWLLAEPTSRHILRRDFWLNGYWMERYAHHYMAILLECFKDEYENGKGKARMELRRYENKPTYRMVLSDTRVVVQKYGRHAHGRSKEAIVAHRVVSAYKLNEELLPMVEGALEEFAEAKSQGQLSVVEGNKLHDKIAETLALSDKLGREKAAPGIYMHYCRSFDTAWASSPDGEEFVDDWDAPRLNKWARLCGYSKKAVKEMEDDPLRIAYAVCSRLGLSDLLESVRRLKP